MPISETQLETWSHQGSIAQSADTYAALRGVLERSDAPYSAQTCSIFLQGSYGNDTNIYADSDVDIVMLLTSVYYDDTEDLPASDAELYRRDTLNAQYGWTQFRAEVAAQLEGTYGAAVAPGAKAVRVDAGGGRRDADVLPAAEFRRYLRYDGSSDQQHVDGICFWLPDGTQVVNYPRQHSANLTAKHQRTGGWLKPMVRIVKNMRNAMVAKGFLAGGVAPSYFLEGTLHNVPDAVFGGSYGDTLFGVLSWLHACDRAALECANGQFVLLHPHSPVTWRTADFETYLEAAIVFWNMGG